jgi:hypothetical protein
MMTRTLSLNPGPERGRLRPRDSKCGNLRTRASALLSRLALVSACLFALPGFSHDTGEPHDDAVIGTNQLPFVVETKGPVKAPAPLTEPARVSGQGFWKFVAVTNLVPVPEAALPFVKGAHGTLIVDAERDVVYWGLKKVGWVGFSNQLRDSWIVQGDPAFTHNNLHGADILPRKGQLPLVAAADNEGYKVYLSDTTFLHPQTLPVPDGGPYATNKTYRPHRRGVRERQTTFRHRWLCARLFHADDG